MNADDTVSPSEIIALFAGIPLAKEPKITRIREGFTNEVYRVDDHILKICVDTRSEPDFEREVFLYESLRGIALIPEPKAVDLSKSVLPHYYMIYRRIEGEPAGSRWHLLNDGERRNLVADLCGQLRRIDSFPMDEFIARFHGNTPPDTKAEMLESLLTALETVREREILPDVTVTAIRKYLREHADVLNVQKPGLTFWDVQWDNMLIDSENKLAALIDFGGLSIMSLDFRLMIVRAMSERPHLFLREDLEGFACVEDYRFLMDWYREFYPELFDFPDLERRLDLYELNDVLRHFPDWPKSRQLHDRLARILADA